MKKGKHFLRKQMKARLYDIDDDTYEKMCTDIAIRLMDLPIWQDAKTIGTTVSRRREINTTPLIQKAWKQGKAVAVPKADPQVKAMDFRKIHSYQDVETAYAGIQEPIEELTESVSNDDIDLLMVPGLLFDRQGYRIGFGGGYYDRYLIAYNKAAVSLALDMQVIDSVPKESFDRPVDFVVTETKVIETNNFRM